MATALKGHSPLDEGDYSGRGTWANRVQYCQYRYLYFRGKRVAFPGYCLRPARPGHATCVEHADRR